MSLNFDCEMRLWKSLEKTLVELLRVERERDSFSDLYNQRFKEVQELKEQLAKSHHVCCNYLRRTVGECNCVAIMKEKTDG